MKDTVRVNFEFPKTAYPYLKMICSKTGVSLKDFATEALIKAIEDAEDKILAQIAIERLENTKDEDLISWDDATQLAGWDNENIQNSIQQKVSKKPRSNSPSVPKKNPRKRRRLSSKSKT
jgi:predicted DNA-binding protein